MGLNDPKNKPIFIPVEPPNPLKGELNYSPFRGVRGLKNSSPTLPLRGRRFQGRDFSG